MESSQTMNIEKHTLLNNIKINRSKMRRNNGNRVGGALQFAVCCLMLFAFAGSAVAQDDPLFVIKKDNHYLAHVKVGTVWRIKSIDNFYPDSCLWHSGNTSDVLGRHHNYYFHDGENYRFLSAPLKANETPSLSASLPPLYDLRNSVENYYFYDWDMDNYPYDGGGVARGYRYYGVNNAEDCGEGHSWNESNHECWEVYWLEYDNGIWRTSAESSYGITGNAGRFREVAVTAHEKEIVSGTETGGLASLSVGGEMQYPSNQQLGYTVSNYSYSYYPAYNTYVFQGGTHNFFDNTDNGTSTPGQATSSGNTVSSCLWTISGAAKDFLSFSSDSDVNTSDLDNPTLYYRVQDTMGTMTANITLVVTYSDNSKQSRSAQVVVKTDCQNPAKASNPRVAYNDVTVSWYPTAQHYNVYWKKTEASTWQSTSVGDVTSYTFTGLEYGTAYNYKVVAICGGQESNTPAPYVYTFTTGQEAGLIVYGSVFGGGRMADVDQGAEVVIINCDSIGAVYGGNDIAGSVNSDAGATITLGVDASNEATSYSYLYNNGAASNKVRVHDVYGGGNGYYAYGSTSFEPASSAQMTLQANASVYALSPENQWNDSIWANPSSTEVLTLTIPSIIKTQITVTNDQVKVDSLFGGAKNAFLTATSGYGSDITVNGGTILAVFGGNNVGGTQGEAKHHIVVNQTKTYFHDSIVNSATRGYGREFGIRYLFGGGNKVKGSATEVLITGGQCDTIFGGGNAADVTAADVTVNCPVGANTNEDGITFNKVYSNAISAYYPEKDSVAVKNDYGWNGLGGIYNVRTLFGGNNQDTMRVVVPNITLTSGSIGTVYGGGNEGDMLAQENTSVTMEGEDPLSIQYGTHVVMDAKNILIDYLYGGCQKSNVAYSTWTEIKKGHVGSVYGGCNVSGDVGSTRVDGGLYQKVKGGTYVKATGGIVHRNLIGGSNGYYHCNDGISYIEGQNYGDPQGYYIGLPIPTHNETHVIVSGNAKIEGNVYAGGNMSPVGFTDNTIGSNYFPKFVGWASVRMDGGTVNGDVYGGGNMASILGSNEVKVSGGTIRGAVYGGNDRSGQAGQISNRVLEGYNTASDGYTSLTDINTFVSITGTPEINTVYGGGNGDYNYSSGYCNSEGQDFTDKPIQNKTFVDINIDGDTEAGHINTVYGGGNGVTVTGGITVFINVNNATYPHNHVDTIFGGNNKDNIANLLPNIILLRGQAGTVYGGCNKGAMTYNSGPFTIGDNTYNNVGSMVRLRNTYPGINGPVTPTAVVSQAVYGGCRMNDVTYNSLVLVEGSEQTPAIPATLFGGCDISGNVGVNSNGEAVGTSRVVVTSGHVNGDIFGGGNGYYTYADNNVYPIDDPEHPIATGTEEKPITAPLCGYSRVDIIDGQVGADASSTADVFGGGYGQLTNTIGDVEVNFGKADAASAAVSPVMFGDIYGGSALGSVNYNTTNTATTTTVNFLNGTLTGNVYGGGLGAATLNDYGYISQVLTEASVYGTVHVNIGSDDEATYSNYLFINGKVFGGNNLAGSPQGNVYVDVYRTAHTDANVFPVQIPMNLTNDFYDSHAYAISEVYGGGNLAHHAPSSATDTMTYVHIHNCDNTIKYVYGGGNAANVPNSYVTIDGGLFNYVFGGGNGYGEGNPGANILYDDTLSMNGGLIGYVFAGSNTRGMVYGNTGLVFGESTSCPTTTRSINELYGGGNHADDGNGITLNVPCGVRGVKYLYGGSRQANVGTSDHPASIVLNVRGGSNVHEEIQEVYGGNNISGTIYGNVTLNLLGGYINKAFGGNNTGGDILGTIQVNVMDTASCPLHLNTVYGGGNLAKYQPTYTPSGAERISPEVNIKHGTVNDAVFGGGYGATAVVHSSPKVTIGDNSEATYKAIVGAKLNNNTDEGDGNVFGGGDLAAVNGNTLVVYNDENTESHVNNIFGGGNGTLANGADINGIITVNMINGTVVDTIFGGCNIKGVVSDSIVVTVTGGISGNVIGGGNKANYKAPDAKPNYPFVHIVGGEVAGKVVAGGNKANIDGNPRILVEGGTIGTSMAEGAGVYGGCNIKGVVTGNTLVELTGGTVGVSSSNTANIHGGGYGKDTEVKGNVLVNFGEVLVDDITDKETHTQTPLLYGDLYGGSALGSVNTNESNTTTVNLLNGVIRGAAYGGGLGQKNGVNGTGDIAAPVNGKVQVNIGTSAYRGQANLSHCDVYGCNNLNGSPQDDVHVDVYQTYQMETDSSNYIDVITATYAIHQVFGGGNQSDFKVNGKKCIVFVHQCKNTIERVFGGGNAASVWGTDLTIDGGRFDEVFGGGNGEVTAADIVGGGIHILLGGGRINQLVNGSNVSGTITGGIESNTMVPPICDVAIVLDYYMGNNQTDYFGDINANVWCGEANPVEMKFVNLYCGSNRAQIYGDVNLYMEGGVFENVFGGSKGRLDNPSTEEDESFASNIYVVTQEMIDEFTELQQSDLGRGGNINLHIKGGTIGNLYGGCDQNGNVQGKITIVVELDDNTECPSFIGNIYGAGNHTDYTPIKTEIVNGTVSSPEIKILKGTIGGTAPDKEGVGLLPILDPGAPAVYEGNVFGGGNEGNVTANPKVIVGDKDHPTTHRVIVEGNVYGGGNKGNVNGSPQVIIAPTE